MRPTCPVCGVRHTKFPRKCYYNQLGYYSHAIIMTGLSDIQAILNHPQLDGKDSWKSELRKFVVMKNYVREWADEIDPKQAGKPDTLEPPIDLIRVIVVAENDLQRAILDGALKYPDIRTRIDNLAAKLANECRLAEREERAYEGG